MPACDTTLSQKQNISDEFLQTQENNDIVIFSDYIGEYK